MADQQTKIVMSFEGAQLVNKDGVYFNPTYTGSKAQREAGKVIKTHEHLAADIKVGKKVHRVVSRLYKDSGSHFLDLYEASSADGLGKFVGNLDLAAMTGGEALAECLLEAQSIGTAASVERAIEKSPVSAFLKSRMTAKPSAKAQS